MMHHHAERAPLHQVLTLMGMSRWATRACPSRAPIVIVQAPATVRRAATRMAVAGQHRAAR